MDVLHLDISNQVVITLHLVKDGTKGSCYSLDNKKAPFGAFLVYAFHLWQHAFHGVIFIDKLMFKSPSDMQQYNKD